MTRRSLRALVLLTAAMLQRLAREGLILRSLTFPTGLTVGTLMLTIGIVAFMRSDPLIALTPDLADLAPVLAENELRTVIVEDPEAWVEEEDAWAGTDGRRIWASGSGPKMLLLESVVRDRVGASWRPDADVPRPPLSVARAMGQRIIVLLGALFALYGVVFGAGMVARDRDDGSFEAELALPVPRWVHGAVRLLTGTLSLSAFFALGVFMVEAVIGLPDAGAVVRHGIACAVGATGIGLLAIGRGGLKSGFTGPLASGMSVATAVFALGFAAPALARWVPLASFGTGASGWEALAGSAVFGLVVVAVFTRRSART